MGWRSKPRTPAPSAEEIALAEKAAQDWNRYVSAFLPLQDELLRRTHPTEGRRRSLMSAVQANVAEQTGNDVEAVDAGYAAGLGAGSGRTALAIADNLRAGASALGFGTAGVDRALKKRELAGLMNAVSTGRGLASDSIRGLSEAGLVETGNALAEMRRRQEWQQGLLSAAATAAGAYTRHAMDRPRSGAGLAGASKPWWDITSGPRKLQ